MSFANFDEIYDICFGMMEEEEVAVVKKNRPLVERVDFLKDRFSDTNLWWEEAAREYVKEKERELVHA